MKTKILNFQQRGDDRGNLVVIEGMQDIPFEIKRIFYIYGSDAHDIRGQHANRKSEFVFINVCGTTNVKVKDGNGYEDVFILNNPNEGLYIPKMVWKDMYDFSPDSVLLVLSSEHYDAQEYIRNYSEFEKEVRVDE